MALRVEKVLFGPAMGIMAGNAGSRPGVLPLVGVDKARCALIVTLDAELLDRCRCQAGMIGTVGAMAGGATFGRRRVQGTVPPVLGHFFVAAETKGRLTFFQVPGMR